MCEKIHKYGCPPVTLPLFQHPEFRKEERSLFQGRREKAQETVLISENRDDTAVFIISQNTALLLLFVYLLFFSQYTVIAVLRKVLV